ncbi:uncharacterized protein LOC125527656 isoform X3 [Triticum urartu]|uniref:uncharacterized protein LOC125527656 isoform X3 n=2 Tax=Triticum urartu TaxID=4572 RepID=UPI002043A515|nr:uncharacterized protein LOC125527656 isoform X3 [Triticum urartu]XP_048548130.1 uncharacterized protein LOC125527656 isoform X3 [Triticum urartu]
MKLVVHGDPRCTDRRYQRSRGKCKCVCVKNYCFNSRSVVRSFKRYVAYSNVCGDFIVGWKTSSIRRQHELTKVMIYLLSAHIWFVTGLLCFKILWHQKGDFVDDVRYPHVVYVEKPKARDVDFSDEMIYQAKTTSEMEEVTLKSLNRIPWQRVDVSFKRSRQWIFAHSTIQVQLSLPSLALSFTHLSARRSPDLLSRP